MCEKGGKLSIKRTLNKVTKLKLWIYYVYIIDFQSHSNIYVASKSSKQNGVNENTRQQVGWKKVSN